MPYFTHATPGSRTTHFPGGYTRTTRRTYPGNSHTRTTQFPRSTFSGGRCYSTQMPRRTVRTVHRTTNPFFTTCIPPYTRTVYTRPLATTYCPPYTYHTSPLTAATDAVASFFLGTVFLLGTAALLS